LINAVTAMPALIAVAEHHDGERQEPRKARLFHDPEMNRLTVTMASNGTAVKRRTPRLALHYIYIDS
jgi:hypothetical protein